MSAGLIWFNNMFVGNSKGQRSVAIVSSGEFTPFGRCGRSLGFGLVLALGLLVLARESHAENLVGKRVTVIHWGAEFHARTTQ